jgi:diacylglycerol O-acyltransferase-1
VHKWLKRHVYVPLVAGRGLPNPRIPPSQVSSTAHGVTKFQASLLIFFISAIFHELVVAPPVKILKLHAFFGMLAQIPLVVVSQHLETWYRKRWPQGVNTAGNMLMWFTFCIIGQPMGAILYYVYV